jgi:hypothetical protein
MEYLNRVLGIRVVYLDDTQNSIPNFISARYRIQKVMLDGKKAIFVYPKMELDSVNSVKKHLDRIERTEGVPVVLVLEYLTYRQKEYLLRDRIPFIVEGKQIYLPFMAVYLQERGDGERRELAFMLPSSQLLLLYYIYHGCGELMTSEASRKLAFTATTISRASRQLAEMGLIETKKRGVQKFIISDKTPKELFAVAKSSMCNPVKRTLYVPEAVIDKRLLMSGYTALSEYTMMNAPIVKCFAAVSVSAWEGKASARLQSSADQYEVQLWRYDPGKLSEDSCVDRLSLALSLSGDRDERVEASVDEMLGQVWRDIDGKRN